MSTEQQLSHFSLISRLFGNLFYRAPTDPLLSNVFAWLQQKGLSQVWALDTDAQSEQALDALQMKIDLTLRARIFASLWQSKSAHQNRDYRLWHCGIRFYRISKGTRHATIRGG